MELGAEQLEVLKDQAAKEGIPVEMLVTRLILQEALDMIERTARRPRPRSAVVIKFPG